MDKLPLFENYIMEAYETDTADVSSNKNDLLDTIKRCFRPLFDDTFDIPVPTSDQIKDKVHFLLIDFGLWWSKSFESDLAKSIAHATSNPELLKDLDAFSSSMAEFLWQEYQKDSPNDDIVLDMEEIEEIDREILADEGTNKSEKIRLLMGKYTPSILAKAIGTSPQVVRNVRKKARQ